MNIQNNAMLATLSVSMFGTNKSDRKESESLANAKHATHDSVRVVKSLFDKKDIAEIKMLCTKARTIHNKYTLPWNDHGQRILPCSVYPKYQIEMAQIKSDFDYTVDLFCKKYDDLKLSASQRLGELYDDADYPSAEDVKSRYKIHTSVSPMPKADDFRVAELSDADIQAVKKSYEVEINERIVDAVDGLIQRLFDATNHMYKSLIEGRSFHQSSFDKLRDLIELAPSLNVTKDPEIDNLINRLSNECSIHSFDSKMARENLGYRKQKVDSYGRAVEDILENFMGGAL
jgi:hypothetical protein